MLIWMHLLAAVLAVVLGAVNLAAAKGTRRHRFLGWCWMLLMVAVTVPSFWIRELNDGRLSWIHLLTVWTLVSMGVALVSIRMGAVKTHARFMIGTMIGACVAGGFALLPGRFISTLL